MRDFVVQMGDTDAYGRDFTADDVARAILNYPIPFTDVRVTETTTEPDPF